MLERLSFGQLIILLVMCIVLFMGLVIVDAREEAEIKATLNEVVIKYDNTLEQLNLTEGRLEASEEDVYHLHKENDELKLQIEMMKLEIEAIMLEYEQYKTEVESSVSRGSFNREDMQMLYRLVESECSGQSFEAKLNVCHVVLNRVESDEFPDTIQGVIFQPRQFSVVSDGRLYQVVITEETIEAVEYALNSVDTTKGALFFMQRSASDKSNIEWFDKLEFVMQDDSGHEFFRKKEANNETNYRLDEQEIYMYRVWRD